MTADIRAEFDARGYVAREEWEYRERLHELNDYLAEVAPMFGYERLNDEQLDALTHIVVNFIAGYGTVKGDL